MVFYVVVEETTLEIAKMSKMSGGNAVINIRTVKMHICVCVCVSACVHAGVCLCPGSSLLMQSYRL